MTELRSGTEEVNKGGIKSNVSAGDLTFGDNVDSEDICLEGLQQELEDFQDDEVVANILAKGTELWEYTKGVEENLRQVELESIQDYINESDNLVSLHSEIRECDSILTQMESLLGGFQEELLLEHFNDLIRFVKTRAGEDTNSSSEKPVTVNEVEPLVKDFACRWKGTIEVMHKDVITSFSNFLCGMEILKAALTQLLLYYTRLSDCIKRIGGSSALNKELVSISSIMYEIKKYSRTF